MCRASEAVGGLASLGIAAWAFSTMPSASFYLPVTRFWPFALGMVTGMMAHRLTLSKFLNLSLTVAGFMLFILAATQPGL